MTNIKTTRQAVCLLARQLIKAGFEQSQAMRTAWAEIKQSNLFILEAKKVSGQTYKRVVSTDLSLMPPRTGTGRPKPEGLRLFIDWGKHIASPGRSVISTYTVTNLVAV